jgi:hypothetical protein
MPQVEEAPVSGSGLCIAASSFGLLALSDYSCLEVTDNLQIAYKWSTGNEGFTSKEWRAAPQGRMGSHRECPLMTVLSVSRRRFFTRLTDSC